MEAKSEEGQRLLFVALSKRLPDGRPRVIEVAVRTTGKKDARQEAERIAKEEGLQGFTVTGVA